jgi:uncharacterized membrane protein YbhN (UPF0104 family)
VDSLTRAADAFLERLGTLGWGALALAALCHLVKLVVRSRAWRNVLAEAYSEESVRWRSVFGAYAAGVGVNAILPARGGDLVKLYLAKHRIEGATYPTLTASLLVEAVFDAAVGAALLVWALSLGVLPGLDTLRRLPAIDWLWVFHHPQLAAGLGLAATVAAVALYLFGQSRWRDFRNRVAQGVVILRRPRRYLRRVAAWQALDWMLRLATIYFVLRGFGLVANLHNALLVQVTQSLSTLMPLTPGGLGTEQALLVYVFRGEAPTGALLSFSVGRLAVLTVVNVVVGFAAIGLMLRTFRWRRRVESEVPEAR